MSQNHFTLQFPLKSPADAKALAEQLPPMMPAMFQAEDAIGTIHYSRFTVLSDKTLLFLGDFDGEFGQLMADLAKPPGRYSMRSSRMWTNPPATPAADHRRCVRRVGRRASCFTAVNLYTAYPDVTAQEIKALAAAADVSGAGELHPFLVILPHEVQTCLHRSPTASCARGARGTTKDLDKVGTPHFAQFVPLEDNQIGFFTVYDGAFNDYIADFTKNIGPIFDLLFKFTKGAPPSPCSKHLQEFIDFAAGANRTPIGFYQAYPGLSVQDIHALIADSKAGSGGAMSEDKTQSPAGKGSGGLWGRLVGHGEHSSAERPSGPRDKSTLDLGDIQGFILRGYRMPMVRHFLLTVGIPAQARKLLGRLVSGDESDAPQITTAADWHVGLRRDRQTIPPMPRAANPIIA